MTDESSNTTPSPKARARGLRRSASDAENKLWFYLKNRQLGGAETWRQVPYGPYYLDFYRYEAFLVVEIDGSQHFELANAKRDEARTEYLEGRGLRVIRFNNLEVLQETQAVLSVIFEALTPSP
jgi:very-short-patch-repair endonuclease